MNTYVTSFIVLNQLTSISLINMQNEQFMHIIYFTIIVIQFRFWYFDAVIHSLSLCFTVPFNFLLNFTVLFYSFICQVFCCHVVGDIC